MESDKKLGDAVVVNYGVSGLLRNCFVQSIKFDEGKVYYDVKIFPFPDEEDNKDSFFIIKDVDSYFIELPTDRFIGRTNMPLELD